MSGQTLNSIAIILLGVGLLFSQLAIFRLIRQQRAIHAALVSQSAVNDSQLRFNESVTLLAEKRGRELRHYLAQRP